MIKDLVSEFNTRRPADQLIYLKTEPFLSLEESQRIEFLKEMLLQEHISSKVVAAGLKTLRELRFKDRFFFKRFLDHPDSSVVIAAKKAIHQDDHHGDTDFFRVHELIKKQNKEKRYEAVKKMIDEQSTASEELLLSFLIEDNLKIRELVVGELSNRKTVDERKLLNQVERSVWYIRSAIIEILGNRRSELIFEKIDAWQHDLNVDVKLKLIGALSRLDRERVKGHLQQLTNDTHTLVKKEAQRTLERI